MVEIMFAGLRWLRQRCQWVWEESGYPMPTGETFKEFRERQDKERDKSAARPGNKGS